MNKKMKNKITTKQLVSICAGLLVGQSPVYADVVVDTELLLLVDVSGSVDSNEYGLMMGGYADAFRNLEISDSIGQGANGAIAVSLMFWSASSQQSVGVEWMKINDESSANSFADAIDSTVRPFQSLTAIGSALTVGTQAFGLETGGEVSNGFSSITQMIDISGDGLDNDTPPASDRAQNVRDARDASIAAGVDMINGLPIGNAGGALEQYYIDNVIASSIDQEAFTQKVDTFSDVAKSLEVKLSRELKAGAEVSVAVSAVPEPSGVTLLGIGSLLFCLRRKRSS